MTNVSEPSKIDVLIVTALQLEYEALRAAFGTEVRQWVGGKGTVPYEFGTYTSAAVGELSIAIARPTRMGANSTTPVVSTLLERLKPRCLAMSGVCAGNPGEVALGDVIFAETTYTYDEGKRNVDEFQGDHRQNPMVNSWVRIAQELKSKDMPSYGAPSELDQKIWAFERLSDGQQPNDHLAFDRYFQSTDWPVQLEAWLEDELVIRHPNQLGLTNAGAAFLDEHFSKTYETPNVLPFEIVVRPMASGNAVVKDGKTWEDLRGFGVRSVAGLEMEAAAIGRAAYTIKLDHWLVVKGVMDHADPNKDDRYKQFAARASAEVLITFLNEALPRGSEPTIAKTSVARNVFVIGGITRSHDGGRLLEADRLAHVSGNLGRALAIAGANLVVCSPFPNSADVSVALGYADAGVQGRIDFHSPTHEDVDAGLDELIAILDESGEIAIGRFHHVAPLIAPGDTILSEGSWSQAWRASHSEALRHADVVIAIGGRVDKSAIATLTDADRDGIPIVPFAFLGGAAAHIYRTRKWDKELAELLENSSGIAETATLLEQVLLNKVERLASTDGPPQKFFISRANPDGMYADAAADVLASSGLQPLLGDQLITGDRSALATIDDQIRGSDVCIVLWSSAYANSRYCIRELELALDEQENGTLNVWLFNLQNADVSHSRAQHIPQVFSPTTQSLRAALGGLIDS